MHTLVILNGRRLTRADFASLRAHARNRALTQRRLRDRVRRRELLEERSASPRPPFPFQRRDTTKGRFYPAAASLCSYICPICDRYQALPYKAAGYRCLVHGLVLRRERSEAYARTHARDYGLERALFL